MTTHVEQFFKEVSLIAGSIHCDKIEKMAQQLAHLRDTGGRLFLLGVGGSAANCSHAVNDFRKLCGIEAYSPIDNVSELTARTNDEGWETVFVEWLKVSKLTAKDAILIFSVGGGDRDKGISVNIVSAIDYAKSQGACVLGIVGKETGYTAKMGDVVVVIPALATERVTPHSEAFQGVVWHCLVSHPVLQQKATKWESVVKKDSSIEAVKA